MTVDHEHRLGGPVHDHDPENPWAGQGSVVLDIGGDVGALVVDMPATMTGVEVEIRPVGAPPSAPATGVHHPHVAVVDRHVGVEVLPSLVYPDLREGTYELYEKGTGHVELTAVVQGGVVTEASWPRSG